MTEPTNEAERPKLPSPSMRLHEVTLAALTRKPVTASEEVEVSRNAKGDFQFTVSGVRGEEETIAACTSRVLDIVNALEEKYPLSRAQNFGRDYLPNEKGTK